MKKIICNQVKFLLEVKKGCGGNVKFVIVGGKLLLTIEPEVKVAQNVL